MITRVEQHNQSGVLTITQKLKDFKTLVKFRLNLTVVFSAVMAYFIAGATSWIGALVLALGGFLVTGAANALNQVLERDYDAQMKRTADRPVATGRMTVSEAVLLSGFMSLFGVSLLALFNPWAALLGMVSMLTYAFVYTPLKRMSPISVTVGAVPGALPVMIGCVAAQGEITMLAFALFAIQFFWQFPHFWAIAWLAHEDYHKAGFVFLPNEEKTRNFLVGQRAILTALLLIPCVIWASSLLGASIIATISLCIISLIYASFGWRFSKNPGRKTALALMFSSFFYLPIVLTLLLLG